MIQINEAQHQLQQSIDSVSQSHQPIVIAGQTSNTVLSSETESALVADETLYLLSVPGMRESIREGMATPIERGVRSSSRASLTPFRLVTWLTIRAIISDIIWYAIA